jgi:hypothetical protein
MYDRSLSVHFQGTNCETGGVSMSRSCDCLTQTDISAVLTPKNELPPVAGLTFPFFHLKRVDIPLDSSGDSDAANSGSFTALQQQRRRDRSRSPRPQTLPGKQTLFCDVTQNFSFLSPPPPTHTQGTN